MFCLGISVWCYLFTNSVHVGPSSHIREDLATLRHAVCECGVRTGQPDAPKHMHNKRFLDTKSNAVYMNVLTDVRMNYRCYSLDPEDVCPPHGRKMMRARGGVPSNRIKQFVQMSLRFFIKGFRTKVGTSRKLKVEHADAVCMIVVWRWEARKARRRGRSRQKVGKPPIDVVHSEAGELIVHVGEVSTVTRALVCVLYVMHGTI